MSRVDCRRVRGRAQNGIVPARTCQLAETAFPQPRTARNDIDFSIQAEQNGTNTMLYTRCEYGSLTMVAAMINFRAPISPEKYGLIEYQRFVK